MFNWIDGGGPAIAIALIQEAISEVRMVTVNAGNNQAPKFWDKMGFHQVNGKGWTHEQII